MIKRAIFSLVVVLILLIIGCTTVHKKTRYEIRPGEKKVIKKEVTIPAAKTAIIVKVNEYEKTYVTNDSGKAQINLLDIISNFTEMPEQLKVIYTANVAGEIITKKLIISHEETKKLFAQADLIATGCPKSPPNLVVNSYFEKCSGIIKAGSTEKIIITVDNKGKGEAYQLKGKLRCSDPIFKGKEIFFGRIYPGKFKTKSVSFSVPKEYPSKLLKIELYFSEYNGYEPEPHQILLRIIGNIISQ